MNTTTGTHAPTASRFASRGSSTRRGSVFSLWTDPKLLPNGGRAANVVRGDTSVRRHYRFQTAYGVVEGEVREVDAPGASCRLP